MATPLPLAGIRVLDLSRVLAGPFCCQILADLGADVVKVERPGTGDETRQWGPPFAGENGPSAYYLSVNRGKRSLALDLSHPDSRPVLDDLLRTADVMVENFLPQSLAKLGLDDERLKTINPGLVRCSISGFGRTGPMANTPGYDLVIQAMVGMMSITGEPDSTPMKVGVAVTDVITGLYAAVSVLAGLLSRGRTQGGMAFDLALADCTLAALVNVAQGALITGRRPNRFGNAHPHIVPYEAFSTADGYMVLGIGNDGQWQRFCKATEHEDWSMDSRFASNPSRVANRGELIPMLQALLKTRTRAEWSELLSKHDIPHAPVLYLDETLASPQVAARDMIQKATDGQGHTFPLLQSPVHWNDEPVRRPIAPPALGEHTDEVLKQWLGYDAQKIHHLKQSQIIAG